MCCCRISVVVQFIMVVFWIGACDPPFDSPREPPGKIYAPAAVNPIDSTDDVTLYALGCYELLGIKPENLKDQKGAKDVFDCTAGTPLPTEETDLTTGKTTTYAAKMADGKAWPDGTATVSAGFPASCDTPSWLVDSCYGNSYIQRLKTGNQDVSGVLLCRHKKSWLADPKKFDDIAIILHNHKTGDTCWFQAPDGDPKLNGTQVPAPHGGADAKLFWMKPATAASVHCVGCHDNGAYMNSPWMRKAMFDTGEKDDNGKPILENVVPDDGHGKYQTPGKAFKDAGWEEAAFIEVGDVNLHPEKAGACTSCHKISKKLYDGKVESSSQHGNGELQGSYGRWIRWVTGGGTAAKTSAFGRQFPRSHWMPSSVFPPTENKSYQKKYPKIADWENAYKKHLKALMECSKTGGTAKGCAVYTPVALNPIGNNPTTTVVATSTVTGSITTSVATVDDEEISTMITTTVGDSFTFSWNTEAVTACVTVLTFPEDVEILGLTTGSNFTTASGSISLGTLNEPGVYAIRTSCDGKSPPSTEYRNPPSLSARVFVRVRAI
ncbi:MAG: hypothetical protein HUU55_18930 [Myxococcales bacterium]|nr:hypothetical protein [Myxococcales bacterium]